MALNKAPFFKECIREAGVLGSRVLTSLPSLDNVRAGMTNKKSCTTRYIVIANEFFSFFHVIVCHPGRSESSSGDPGSSF